MEIIKELDIKNCKPIIKKALMIVDMQLGFLPSTALVTCPVFIEARRKLIRNILDRAEEYKDT
jgi:hypothetical protein